MIIDVLVSAFGYLVSLGLFMVFLWKNEGIVVGDKSAHLPTLHFAQLGYCVAFIAVMNSVSILQNLESIIRNFKFVALVLSIGSFYLMIEYSTKVHPYLLADNRHVVFYVWNKVLQHKNIQYLAVLIYAISFLALKHLFGGNGVKLAALVVITGINCVPQLLLEFRYFILPLVFYQMEAKLNVSLTVGCNLVVSGIMLAIFMMKDVYWSDIRAKQMIIW